MVPSNLIVKLSVEYFEINYFYLIEIYFVQEFRTFILEFCEDKKPKNSAIVFIMSHGKQPKIKPSSNGIEYYSAEVEILMRDNVTVSSEWIVDQFSTINCPALAGKPKIIMFTACRY